MTGEVPSTVKKSISMPAAAWELVTAAVESGQAPNPSAYIAAAVADRAARERTRQWIMSRRGGQPIDPEAIRYWREQFGASAQEPGQVPA
jgi:hypothetical protein